MSNLYSTELKTQYLDPRVDISNRICEFRFDPETAYYPNITLAGLKGLASVQTKYNGASGALSMIKHIRLLDGRIELDSVRFYNRFAAFQNINNTNRFNLDVGGNLQKSSNGYLLEDTKGVHDQEGVAFDSKARVAGAGGAGAPTARDEALIDLRVVLPMLNNITYLDTSVFKNLKIVIEWETDVKTMLAASNVTLATQTPTLIVDEIVSDSIVAGLKSKLQNVVWNAIEHDMFQVSDQTTTAGALGAGATQAQNTNVTINGYDNKYVERVLICKSFSDKTKNFVANTLLGIGDGGSYAQHKEAIQVQVNGKPLFTGSGLDRPATKQMLLHQTWGEMNIPPSGAKENVGLASGASVNVEGEITRETVNGQVNSQSNRVGQYDFVGFTINNRINSLRIEHKREILQDAFAIKRNSLGLDIHTFCEVRRGLTLGASDYNVKYL